MSNGLVLDPLRPRTLVVGDNAGIAPLLSLLTGKLRDAPDAGWKPLVLLGSDEPFPFRARPSTILVPGMPQGVIACVPVLEEWGVPSRLASQTDFPGCYDGNVIDLAIAWLESLDAATLAEVEMIACGSEPMLQAAADVAGSMPPLQWRGLVP